MPTELLAQGRTNFNLDLVNKCINVPLNDDEGGEKLKSIVVTGDWGPDPSHFVVDRRNEHLLYGDLLPIIRDADLSITNLESVFSRSESAPIHKDGPALKLAPQDVSKLGCVPFHIACLANNHIFDYGINGFEDTVEILQENGVKTLGAHFYSVDANEYLRYQLGDVTIALYNVAEGEEAFSQQTVSRIDSITSLRFLESISQAKEECDVVLVIAHAGREYLPVPAPYIRDLYRSFVDYGADIVVAHHPHVPQGIEVFKNSPILYSLGNLLFGDHQGSLYQSVGNVLKVNISDHQLVSLQLFPYRISQKGIQQIHGKQLEDFYMEMRSLSALVEDDSAINSVWHAYSDHWLKKECLNELAFSLTSLLGIRKMMLSGLIVMAHRLRSAKGIRRIFRSLLWRSIHFLENRWALGEMWDKQVFTSDEVRGAAILRNRFNTLAHRDLYLTALGRVVSGDIGNAPKWAQELILEWEKESWLEP